MNEDRTNAIDDSRFRLLIDAVIDYAIYMLDPDGIITSWNSGARRFKGYEESEILGQHFSRFYTEEDRRAGLPQRALDTAIREGRFEGEGWRVRKDGTHFWCHVVIDPILDPSGKLLGFAKITRDLTDRKMAEEVLKQSEQQFRLLVQSVTDYAIYMLAPDGRLTNWNPGAQRIKGYLPEEVIGKHFSMFYTPEDREAGEPQRTLDIAVREGRFENKGWRVRKDGTRFLANVVVDPIWGETGTLLGFAKITRDITEVTQAQQTLEQTREALFQAQKMQAIGQLSGGIAHDFNNLLTVILGNLEIVRKRVGEDPKITRLVDNATQGALRGVSLTQRMLAFARRQELKAEPVEIPALVQGIIGLLRSSLGPSVVLETRFSPELEPVLADVNQLELAVLNLVTNARDAMPHGGKIVISTKTEETVDQPQLSLLPGRYVCLSVSDTGEGMDETTLGSAMDPFFTTKGIGKGTGLGLSMVHGYIEQLGGRFVLKSQKGIGTVAELWIPIATTGSVARPVAEETAPPVPRLCVLVVDDDSLVLTSTCLLLEDLGHRVVSATSGAQALEVFDAEAAIDLVITDMAMPQMNGAQLAQAIRTKKPDLPIILATGYAERLEGFATRLPRLSKPFTQLNLVEIIASTMK
ncbi:MULTISPECIES: PAS domain-containing sensor histidine kinase [unclassified Pseudomonas]|jgi:PAS domain S-box-containing protein|uniref:hybrid sensor histidine kinase/response regulator n=1 Tax=unclassified Pseudomonas TaxID=196821 RepID=UPI000C87AF54|nr:MULTISPECIES: PAS domain-containing sensor histidine kinase [unclassified Pseudomonas]PMU12115.1 hybrid sensor histidine kinase/response regulator [Pseudomonas sp. FW305-20]PMU20833.1 hybrid sensor histidine kinase/response regulator [Pseudomonas sp. FW305-122]PMU41826.1 hybrid sensor histidine kinase/response regulator [Pseudomonas sp. FW305-47B]PMX65360.1 hybrid sensor histidine kinase/response regulator [Pseudomonas sp. FW305-33]PMX71919.1 hybrid sensor histidine kinase/response regulato